VAAASAASTHPLGEACVRISMGSSSKLVGGEQVRGGGNGAVISAMEGHRRTRPKVIAGWAWGVGFPLNYVSLVSFVKF